MTQSLFMNALNGGCRADWRFRCDNTVCRARPSKIGWRTKITEWGEWGAQRQALAASLQQAESGSSPLSPLFRTTRAANGACHGH